MVIDMLPYSLSYGNSENLAYRERKNDKCDFSIMFHFLKCLFLLHDIVWDHRRIYSPPRSASSDWHCRVSDTTNCVGVMVLWLHSSFEGWDASRCKALIPLCHWPSYLTSMSVLLLSISSFCSSWKAEVEHLDRFGNKSHNVNLNEIFLYA